ncbi:DISARM system SNF2-like helicase DrmD [Leptolyngbya sp. UWPOB_LEPTO1]|uniref:DISARM system SNF2-like helicase DrmD n=1 Tax=Leptolyngbya sp. UWPOB_LEPTO1 TaxID=2815653 RepID=UPI00257F9262|nr:DISARM system SNF2-like helicase DrmD [Leptolyngbya sp. UWPOB_LEPTO1]
MQSPATGQIVYLRSRQYLVEDVISHREMGGDTQVSLSCLEDDAQGQMLEVFWERERDAQILGDASWELVAKRGFDNPRYFSAYLHTLRWNCVTSTNPKLFQAPYRAGIEVKAYQLEPLRKALLMPRVSLFIADDVGLGKTIEAGLILREMLMRQKIRRVVIACPPSVVRQWQSEMESRFGLLFQIVDREFVAVRRRERGYGINPWTTHTRFIISHALIRDETYAAPLRDWLKEFAPGSMLILDEAHNAAPASGSRYAIDSQLTKSIRELAPRFEHKLFLSATPHNGHSNSFAALLEMLDPQRFCRGVPVKNKKVLDAVMVRRLKRDIRELNTSDFPKREVIPIVIDGLEKDAPELALAGLLQEYRREREERLKDAPKSVQNTASLVITSLQKRLLSSIEAFARTLNVHRKAIDKQAQKQIGGTFRPHPQPLSKLGEGGKNSGSPSPSLEKGLGDEGNSRVCTPFNLLVQAPGADDDRAEFAEAEIQAEEDAQMTRATQQINQDITPRELELLAEMERIAQAARYQPDSRMKRLIEWIRKHQCPDLGEVGAKWNHRRMLIFTEYLDTKRYLEQQLGNAIADSDLDLRRIGAFHGGMGEDSREAIKAAFNFDPERHPLRILIATDAAREGVNLQNYCADLFHFDIPWNPSRMEQRNGRIDRKLQREKEVRCYYFVLPQRPEDRVLDVLVRKTATIQEELGSLSPVVERQVSKLLDGGIRSREVPALTQALEQVDENVERKDTILNELEAIRPEVQKLHKQQEELQGILTNSQQWLGLSDQHFRDALSVSLELLGASGLAPMNSQDAIADLDRTKWVVPMTDDPLWAGILDSLRPLRKPGQKLWDWRNENPVRPVVFKDPGTLDGEVVHLHLEHRLVQRLLGRFLAQGFVHNELTRACVCLTDDPIPKVIVLGRLSLYGERASRLHDEIVAIAADWIAPEARGRRKLKALTEGEKKDVLALLETSLITPRLREVSQGVSERLQDCAAQDVRELLSELEDRAQVLTKRASEKLTKRGQEEAEAMRQLLIEQRDRILEQKSKNVQLKLFEETQQLEADRRHWERRLKELETEIEDEPRRIEEIYQVKATRIEPVGLVYLVPVSN